MRADAARLAAELAPDLPIPVIAALVAAWAQVFGIVSFEVFGQFNQVVEARGPFFDQAAAALAAQIGLVPPTAYPPRAAGHSRARPTRMTPATTRRRRRTPGGVAAPPPAGGRPHAAPAV